MGAASSSPLADAFAAQYEALPVDVHDQIEALCAKDDMRLLKPHPAAPPPVSSSVAQKPHALAAAAPELNAISRLCHC